MSRIGKKPIPLPKGVSVKIAPGAIEVQGPKGKMSQYVPPGIVFAQDNGTIVAKTESDEPGLGKFHGLARSLVANAVAGVTDGFKKELDIVGIGYRAELKGKQVVFALGYSHPIVFDIPNRELNVELSDAEIEERARAYQSPPSQFRNGVLGKYARHVGSAAEGAVTS